MKTREPLRKGWDEHVTDHDDGNASYRRNVFWYPPGVGNHEIPVWPGTVFLLPCDLCTGCPVWCFQPLMAADPDHRNTLQEKVSNGNVNETNILQEGA